MGSVAYEEWLLGEGLEASTILNYCGKLERIREICAGEGWEMEALTASQLRAVADRFPQTRSTLGQLKGALAHYYRMVDYPARLGAIKLPSRTGVDGYKGLEDDEAYMLESTARERGEDGLAVLVGLYLGLRRSELVTLRWSDFDDDVEWVDVLGKGSKRRWLPVHPTLKTELVRRHNLSQWVFPGRFDGHVHHGTVYLWVERVGQAAGLGKVHPHALRHTCATRMYEETGDVRVVQQFLGHSDPATTARYTRVPRRRLEAAVATLNYAA